MRRLIVIFAILLVLAGAFAWWWNQPEKVVARRTVDLFQSASVEEDAGSMTRGTRGNAIEGYLAPVITFQGPEGPTEEVAGLQTRDNVVAMYTALARICRRASIQDVEILSVTVTGDKAEVTAKADAVIELQNESRPLDGIQNLSLTWRKVENKWLLEKAAWNETGR